VERRGDVARLVVRDDGRGFDPARATDPEAARRGLGLSGFQERANLLGGSFHCESEPGHGTTLTFEIPVPKPIKRDETN